MQPNRFDAIAAELKRLAEHIAVINSQPFHQRIDLISTRKIKKASIDAAPPELRTWTLHGLDVESWR